jgi:hypothetical protein
MKRVMIVGTCSTRGIDKGGSEYLLEIFKMIRLFVGSSLRWRDYIKMNIKE